MARSVSLRDLSTEQLTCMRGALGHEWESIQKPKRSGQWGYRLHVRCVRCGKERTTIFNIHMREAAHYYLTPDWHLKVTDPYDTWDVRAEYVRRARSAATAQRKAS